MSCYSNSSFKQSKANSEMCQWVGSDMFDTTRNGLKLMNSALKQRVEARSSAEHVLKRRVKTGVTSDALSDM